LYRHTYIMNCWYINLIYMISTFMFVQTYLHHELQIYQPYLYDIYVYAWTDIPKSSWTVDISTLSIWYLRLCLYRHTYIIMNCRYINLIYMISTFMFAQTYLHHELYIYQPYLYDIYVYVCTDIPTSWIVDISTLFIWYLGLCLYRHTYIMNCRYINLIYMISTFMFVQT
jgi:hypothetical protein